MSRHLLLVTLGPVQEFIAQARRTRDLWFGSHLLSELSRAAAAALARTGAKLVFPALDSNVPLDRAELEPSAEPLRPSGEPVLAIANKLLCELPDGLEPDALARTARDAAETQWRDFAERVRARCRALLAPGIDRAWDEQVGTFLEFAAAWTPLPDGDIDGYARARDALERELAGRKLLREFPTWTEQRGTVPKSSLDGARETMLAEPGQRSADLVRRYRIADGEQLDAIGLIKRAGGDPGQFVPIANVALAHWMAVARERLGSAMEGIADLCKREGLAQVRRPDLRCGEEVFPFDAEIFLKDRWPAILKELGRTPKDSLSWTENQALNTVLAGMNAPLSYVACIVADGDHMGRALDGTRAVANHRTFSAKLSHFAARAREIVEQKHRGILVYAGGDDVLAFINVVEVWSCAEALRAAFEESVQSALAGLSDEIPAPTLSVGVGIGHLLESLGHLRRLGGDAERLAKTRRNALAVLLEKRSGGTTRLCEGWDTHPVARLSSATDLLQTRKLSLKKVHEIALALSRMPPHNRLLPGEQEGWARVLRGEVERILARSGEGDGLSPAEAGLDWRPNADYDDCHCEAARWVSRALIANFSASAAGAVLPRGER